MKSLITILLFIISYISFAQQSVRPWMGVYIEEHTQGVMVKDSVDNAPAKKAGLKQGDIIVKVNGEDVKTTQELIEKVTKIGVGNRAEVTYLKSGKNLKVTKMNLVARPDVLKIIEGNLLDKKAPSFKTKVIANKKNKEFDLDKQKGRVTVMMFWATWCPACGQAQPVLAKFAQENKDINVLAISSEEVIKIKKYMSKAKKANATNDHVLFLKGKDTTISDDYFVPVLPLFIVLDKKQVVKSISVGVGPKLLSQLESAKKLSQN